MYNAMPLVVRLNRSSVITNSLRKMTVGIPTHLYKIIPGSQPELLPSPHHDALPLSLLDQESGFIHLSTATQVPGTIKRFFAKEKKVYVLKLDYNQILNDIKWEEPSGRV
jgi:uncharacterized protein (DUF952 family)